MDSLHTKIKRFIRTGDEDFGALALELFAYQFERNEPYRAFCTAQGQSPSTVKEWASIPAVPIGAFKSSLPLCTFPTPYASAVFRSSATTTGTPSQHYLKDLSFYEGAIKFSFGEHVVKDLVASGTPSAPTARPAFLLLSPPPAEQPYSSLTWMLDVVSRTWGGPDSAYFIQRGVLDEPRLVKTVQRLQAEHRPVILLGTTLAFLKWMDYADRQSLRFALPAGSRVMDTGGMKTSKRETTRDKFVDRITAFLGIPEKACYNEYGMCEMSSQFYAVGKDLTMQLPPWVRTQVIDPTTGALAASEAPGWLRHFDLANVDSVLALQTEDMGVALDRGFLFQGRAPLADLKGCSVTLENILK